MTLDILDLPVIVLRAYKQNCKENLAHGRNDRAFLRDIKKDFTIANISPSLKPEFILFSLSTF